ncbi:MAG: cytochrome-c peroxidase [Opitutae bacterium]|nr:cytochrome-c peroxidase [Opitutae bacterium]
MIRRRHRLLGAIVGLVLLGGCAKREAAKTGSTRPPAPVAVASAEPITPIPQTIALDDAKVALGKFLFHTPMLSRDSSVSCATCHPLNHAGTDHLARSLGVNHAEGRVSAPTVFNSGFNFRQFWDGRADSLESQIDGPLESDIEMGSTWRYVVDRLRREPEISAAFQRIYADGVQPANVRNAIAEFERSLITPNSRFDRYLRGETDALTEQERAGYAKFKNYGCISCHQGVNVGANMFQRMGVIRDYFAERGHITPADYGRFNVTNNEADRFFFKVPSLRNVAVTPPYFHDGSAQTLEDAVTIMARFQLGRSLPPEDRADIVQFLRTLTGEFEGQPLSP